MANRPCLTCGKPSKRTRCPTCQRQHDRTRRPPSQARGYDQQYRTNRAIILANNPRCAICHTAPATTADHIIPTSRGGTAELTNLRPACQRCNSARGNRYT